MSVDRIAVFMGLLVAGAVVLQWPLGTLSDRIRRRVAVAGVSFAGALVAVAAAIVDPLAPAALLTVFLFGGLTFPLYSISLSHINDHVPAGSTIAVSAAYAFVAGIGAILGPLAASGSMALVGPPGVFWLMCFVHIVVGVFALARIGMRPGLPVAAQRAFTMVPARAGALVIHLARRINQRNGDSKGD